MYDVRVGLLVLAVISVVKGQSSVYSVSIRDNNRDGGVQVNLPGSSSRNLDLDRKNAARRNPNTQWTKTGPVKHHNTEPNTNFYFATVPQAKSAQQPNYNTNPNRQGWTGGSYDGQNVNNFQGQGSANSAQQPNYNAVPDRQGWTTGTYDGQTINQNNRCGSKLTQTIGSDGELIQIIDKGCDSRQYVPPATNEYQPRNPQPTAPANKVINEGFGQTPNYKYPNASQRQPQGNIQWDIVRYNYNGRSLNCYCPKKT